MADRIRLAEIETAYTSNLRGLEQGASRAERIVQDSTRRINQTMSGIGSGGGFGGGGEGWFDRMLSVAGGNLLSTAISKLAGGFKDAAKAGFEFNDLMERSQIAMETMTGNADKAKKHLDELVKFATKTPFRAQGLVEYSQRLQAVGFAAEDVVPTLRAVGDAVAGLGGSPETLERIVRAMGDIKTKGKVQAEEIRQLANAGIPAWQWIAKAAGTTPRKAQELAEQGRLDADKTIDVLIENMNARYGGLMKKIEGTLSARWATFEDLLQQMSARVGYLPFEGTKKVLGGINAGMAMGVGFDFNSILSGVSGGFDQALNLVKDQGKQIGANLKEGTEEALEMKSPSRVYYRIGLMAAAGFQMGFQDGLMKLEARAGDTLRKIAERLGRGVEEFTAINPGVMPDDPLRVGQEIWSPFTNGQKRGGKQSRRGGVAVVGAEIDAIIEEAAKTYGLDPNLIRAMMHTESRGQANATSPKGARGLMQLMPATARAMGVKNITDPKENIFGGAKYMRLMMDTFGGNVSLALAGYNAGPGAVQKHGGIPPYRETQKYVKEIQGNYQGSGWLGAFTKTNPLPVYVADVYGGAGVLGGQIPTPGDLDKAGGWGEQDYAMASPAGLPGFGSFSGLPTDVNKLFPALGSPEIWGEILDDFAKLTNEVPGGLDRASESAARFGNIVRDAQGRVKGLIIESEEASQRLRVSWDDVAGGFENVFMSAFDSVSEEGLAGFSRNMLLGFAQLIQQLATQALAANLSKLLFGYSGEKGSGGGGILGSLFSSILGGLLGGGSGYTGLSDYFGNAPLPSFASGGNITPFIGQPIQVHADEKILPLAPGYVVPKGGTQSGTVVNNINVTWQQPRGGTFRQNRSRRELAERIAGLLAA